MDVLKYFYLFTLFIFIQPKAYSQERYPKDYFGSPLNIPLYLSGNFGELRNNHFHSGIDIKTQQKEGLKVYAAAKGYVSRIKISPYGYGKALYINHPNGFTTVYGHLKGFNPEIEKIVKNIQHAKEKFVFDTIFSPNIIPIEKSEVIAFSGNTGSSSAPHLHFEIRDTYTEHPLNPLLFGYILKDNIPPKIYNIYIYPLNDSSHVNYSHQKLKIPIIRKNGEFTINSSQMPIIHGQIGFGIHANDFMNGTHNRYGIYSLAMLVDEKNMYYFEINEFSFDETRYLNAHIDYEMSQKLKKRSHRIHVLPAQQLSFISHTNRGIFNAYDNKVHKIDIILSDIYHNRSKINFFVKSDSIPFLCPHTTYSQFMPYNQENIFISDSIYVVIPQGALYEHLKFKYDVRKNSKYDRKIHKLHNKFTPLHKPIDIYITPGNIPQHLKNKSIIVRIDDNNKLFPLITSRSGETLFAQSKQLGKFTISIDTIPPVVKPLFKQKNIAHLKTIAFKISDNLSGIKNYKGTIDGNWVPFEFHYRKKKLIYYFDAERISQKKVHQVTLNVTDYKDNITTFTTQFYW